MNVTDSLRAKDTKDTIFIKKHNQLFFERHMGLEGKIHIP